MMDLVIVSLIIQYVLIFGLSLFVFKMFQYVKNIKTLAAPAQPEISTIPKEGLEMGMSVPNVNYQSLNGEPVRLYDGKEKVVLFTMSNCSACKETYQAVKSFSQLNPYIPITLFLYATDEEEALEMVRMNELGSMQTVWADKELIDSYKATRFPLAFYLSEEQVVVNKRVTNNLSHLNELIRDLPGKQEKTLHKSA